MKLIFAVLGIVILSCKASLAQDNSGTYPVNNTDTYNYTIAHVASMAIENMNSKITMQAYNSMNQYNNMLGSATTIAPSAVIKEPILSNQRLYLYPDSQIDKELQYQKYQQAINELDNKTLTSQSLKNARIQYPKIEYNKLIAKAPAVTYHKNNKY